MIDPIELPENDTLVQKYKNALSVEVDIQMCDDLIQLLEARRIEYEKKTSIKEFNSEKLIIQSLFFTFIATYMKLFNTEYRFNFDATQIYSSNETLLYYHCFLYKMRNTFVAHGDSYIEVEENAERNKKQHFCTRFDIDEPEIMSVHSEIRTHEDSDAIYNPKSLEGLWSYSISPINKRAFSPTLEAINQFKQLLSIVRLNWKQHHDELTNNIAQILVPKHLAKMKVRLTEEEYMKIIRDIKSKNYNVSNEYTIGPSN